MSHICSTCDEVLHENEIRVTCSQCTHEYHFGKCAGIAEKSFKGKSETAKKAWRCQNCRSSVQSDSCRDETNTDADIRAILVSINQKLESLPPLVARVETMEQSVEHMSESFEELKKTIGKQENEIKMLRKQVQELEKRDGESQSVQAQLRREVNELEFRNRQLNLEIHGISFVPGENLHKVINQVADMLETPHLVEQDIASVHRLPALKDKTPGIIVRFTRQAVRDSWLNKRNKLKDSHPRMFIQENLTRHNRELLQATKNWAKASGFKYAWYTHGKVLLRRSDGANAIHVKCSEDLGRLQPR